VATIFKLIIEDDEGKTTVYPLAESEVAIGRRDGNTIRLMERNVSRRHAKLSRTNGTVFIEDLDSYNGIRINGERITGKYEVKEGDLVEIGDYHLALQRTEVQEEAAPAAPQKQDGQWPQAGTVPDFRLPEEILQDVQHGPRDTLHDEPMPQMFGAPTVEGPGGQADPMVRPPPRGEDGASRDLPPFPQPGGQPLARVPLQKTDSETPTERPADKPLAMGPARVSSVPRLVCVSTSYAGKEFALTRPELIIGRVEDNDIVIEHRSVSRNHAKILSNEGTHKIIDLQSANGILVNGEEYAMTDLRKGDLIELGHVRFRFTPANEPFIPTSEEADEMRNAGVEPPSREASKPASSPAAPALEAPAVQSTPSEPAMASYDPSQAATVTDTPLDALQMGQAFAPQLQKAPSAGSNGVATEVKSDPPPKRATADQRPTELNHATRQPASPLAAPAAMPKSRRASQEPATHQARVDDPAPAPPKSKAPLMILMGLLVIVIVVLAVVLLQPDSGGRDTRLEELAQLIKQDDFQGAVDFYEAHKGEFSNESAASLFYEQALDNIEKDEVPDAPPTTPDDPAPIPVPDDPEVDTTPPPPEPPPPPARTKKRQRVRRVKRTPPTENKADQAFERGKTALLMGKLSDAEAELLSCLKLDPKYADCHRNLGVLYAKQDDTPRAVKHYRRYIELAPNAKDADRVRAMLKDVETP
jgi:pSer/pThr/pTyr-binding forkhead associated (FHA) protein